MPLQARVRVRGRPGLPECVCPAARLLPRGGVLHRSGSRSAVQVNTHTHTHTLLRLSLLVNVNEGIPFLRKSEKSHAPERLTELQLHANLHHD